MTGGDGGWAASRDVVTAAFVPGVPTLRRHRRFGSALIVVGVVLPLIWLVADVLRHRSWVALGLDRGFLTRAIVALIVACLARVAGITEVVLAGRDGAGRRLRDVVAIAALAVVAIPTVAVANIAVDARSDIGRAFEPSSDEPIFDAADPVATAPPSGAPSSSAPAGPSSPEPSSEAPSASVAGPADSTTTTTTTTVAPRRKPSRPDSGVDPGQLADISTILLLGGDAGPGRSGLRTDSMILVSIHRPSGRAALISVPRNFEHLLFPPGSAMEARYPYGFDDIANAVYPRVSSNRSLRDSYTVQGLRPGAVAIAEGIGYSLDITIDDYVLIDMAGFVKVIDALGGVTVNVSKAVPTPGNPPNAIHTVPPTIQAGTQHMDGTTALAYVRSRHADTDYQRARRQREVLGALARQVSLGDAISGYSAVTSALGDNLRTSLTTDEFTNLLGLLGAETAIVESVGLVPPLVRPSNPDYDAVAKIVGRVQLALVTGERSGY